jgi:hypothetical protein
MDQVVDKAITLAVIAQLLLLLLNEVKQIKSDIAEIRNTIVKKSQKKPREKTPNQRLHLTPLRCAARRR